jgi:hypothetical protein
MKARMNQHLLIFASVMLMAWALGTSLLVYFWPRLVINLYKRAILNQGFGDSPVPINTLYTGSQALFADPLHAPASASKLATTGVNRDTLITLGWLDLSNGPQILHVPDFSGRYYSVQFTDPFNVNIAYVGTRATGTQAGVYLITGPRWSGVVPEGMTHISSPDNSLLVVGRVLVYNDSDLSTAYELSKQIRLTPLSGWTPGQPVPPVPPVP